MPPEVTKNIYLSRIDIVQFEYLGTLVSYCKLQMHNGKKNPDIKVDLDLECRCPQYVCDTPSDLASSNLVYKDVIKTSSHTLPYLHQRWLQ